MEICSDFNASNFSPIITPWLDSPNMTRSLQWIVQSGNVKVICNHSCQCLADYLNHQTDIHIASQASFWDILLEQEVKTHLLGSSYGTVPECGIVLYRNVCNMHFGLIVFVYIPQIKSWFYTVVTVYSHEIMHEIMSI